MNASAAARATGSVAIRVVARESTPTTPPGPPRASFAGRVATAAAEGAEEVNNPTQTPAGPAAVRFGIRAELDFGEALIVVGGAKELGSWTPESGFALTWSDGNVWQGDLATLTNDAPENSVHSTAVEFKLVVVKPDWGGYWWEEGENRLIDMELIRTGCEVSGAFGGHVKVNAVEGGATPAAGSEPLTHAQKAAQRAVANVQEYPGAVMQPAPPPRASRLLGRTFTENAPTTISLPHPPPGRDRQPVTVIPRSTCPRPHLPRRRSGRRWPRVEVVQGQGPGAPRWRRS